MSDVILLADKLGILDTFNVSDVILLADKLGILSCPNVSVVILLADKLGILSAPNVSVVILLADKFGISLSVKLPPPPPPPPPSDEIDTPFTVKPPVIASVPLISVLVSMSNVLLFIGVKLLIFIVPPALALPSLA